MTINPYEVLGVAKDADDKEIKKAYRQLSKVYHPDKETGNKERFLEIGLAYEVLIDPERRDRFDQTGRVDKSMVTPDRVKGFIAETMRTVVMFEDEGGSTDDPARENIRDKVVASLQSQRERIRKMLADTHQKLNRTNELINRFKSTLEDDPVGKSLKGIKQELEEEAHKHQDALELSEQAERIFMSYGYEYSQRRANPHAWFSQGAIASTTTISW